MIKKFNVEKTMQLDKINKILSLFYKKPSNKLNVNFSKIENILVVDFALMGDMVMNIPFFKTIRHNCPNAKITMVAMPWAKVILGDQNLIDEFIIFDGKNILSSPKSIIKNYFPIRATLKIINKKRYQLAFEPKGDLRHIWFVHHTNSLRTISYNYTGGEYLITDSFKPKETTKHLIDEKIDLLALSGMTIFDEDRTPVLNLSEASKQVVKAFVEENNLNDRRVIGIHPGASNKNKQYRYYPQLIEEISDSLQNDDIFCVFEGPGEKDIVDAVCNQLEKSKIEFIRVKRKTKEYVAIVSVCNYMICNDSAAGHIASGYGIPTLVIFGPVMPETALPRGNCDIRYVSHELECKPCTLPVCPLGTEECIQTIEIDEVKDELEFLLKGDK